MQILCTPLLLIAIVLASAIGCDRNIEPIIPGEKPSQPDLARIFPDSGDAPAPPAAPAQPPSASEMAAAPAGGAPISGTIRIAPELGGAPAGAVLFLVARQAGSQGGPPLAVQRLNATGFPLDFAIGPQDVMIPSMRFEGQISLSARIDSDGNAITRQPGDLQGSAAGSLAPGATGVEILIAERL